MRNEANESFDARASNTTEGNSNDDGCSWDDSDYQFINPKRLKKQAWLAARQHILSDSDDDEDFDDDNDYCSVVEPRRPSRPQTAPPETTNCGPTAFSRPSRYRTTACAAFNRKCTWQSGGDDGGTEYYADGTEIRHTVKSRDMSTFGHLKRCVIDQIDFIKQRDGVWSHAKLYDAVTVLGNFMQENAFRYIYLPDHQRQWLYDMVTRLDQWTNMKIPFSSDFLKHREYDSRRKKYQERVDADCFRLINPANFEKQQAEKRTGQALIHRETERLRKIDQDRRQARLDLIEDRTRDPTRRNRIAQQQMPIESRPPRYPRGSRSLSREPLGLTKPIKLTDPLRAPHRAFTDIHNATHAAKMFGAGIHGRLKQKHSPRRRRAVSRSPSVAINRAIAPQSARQRPKTASNVFADETSRKIESDAAVASGDLVELLQLIQDIEDKQQEINDELLVLREEAKTGSHRPGIREAWWNGKLSPVDKVRNRSSVPGDLSGENNCKPRKIDEAWWDGKKPKPAHVSQAWWDGRKFRKSINNQPPSPDVDEKSGQQPEEACRPRLKEAWWDSDKQVRRKKATDTDSTHPGIRESWWVTEKQLRRETATDIDSTHPRIRESWWDTKQAADKENCRPKLKDEWWEEGKRSNTRDKSGPGHSSLNRRSLGEEDFTCSSDEDEKRPSRQAVMDKVWRKPPFPLPRQTKTKARPTSVGPPKIPEAWWEGKASVTSMPPRALDPAHIRSGRVDTVVRGVYSDVDTAINRYVDQLVNQEFTLVSHAPVKKKQ